MSERTCNIEGCERKHYGLGLCNMHWLRQRRWGDPFQTSAGVVGVAATQQYGLTLAERFWPKVDRDGPVVYDHLGPCWVWTAGTNEHGYGLLTVKERRLGPMLASRLSWELTYGEIPDGLCVLHSCDNPPCVRPAHLFLGTHQDNMDDKYAKGRESIDGLRERWAAVAGKTHCPQGHPYDEANTRVDPRTGHRTCRTCHREREYARRHGLSWP